MLTASPPRVEFIEVATPLDGPDEGSLRAERIGFRRSVRHDFPMDLEIHKLEVDLGQRTYTSQIAVSGHISRSNPRALQHVAHLFDHVRDAIVRIASGTSPSLIADYALIRKGCGDDLAGAVAERLIKPAHLDHLSPPDLLRLIDTCGTKRARQSLVAALPDRYIPHLVGDLARRPMDSAAAALLAFASPSQLSDLDKGDLAPFLSSPSPAVRTAAIRAFGRMGGAA